MRRKDKEITDPEEIQAIMRKAQVCRLAMVDGGRPYIVPLSFGHSGDCLFFHSALQGMKIDILKNNPDVCFELDLPGPLIKGEKACKWSVKYQSVIGFGTVEFVEEPSGKREAFRVIMGHYSDKEFEFSGDDLKTVAIFKVRIAEMSGKQSGY